jgi:hypothetical protein
MTIPQHPFRSSWHPIEVEVVGYRLVDTLETAALEAIKLFCNQHPTEVAAYRLKYVGDLRNGFAYLSRCNSGWFYHIKIPTEIIDPQAIEIESDLTYIEHPVKVLDTKERSTRRKTIKMFKIQWNHHTEEEETWETESYLQRNFPDFLQANSQI